MIYDKLCINCAFIGTNSRYDWETYKCFAPENVTGINPVDGNATYLLPFCISARNQQDACGDNAVWFIDKPLVGEKSWDTVDIDTAISNKEAERAARKTNKSLANHTEDDI